MFIRFLMIGLGGALGSMMRYAVSLLMASWSMTAPIATFCVNSIGSFLITFLAAIITKDTTVLMCTVGFCGGFTTYSTFSSQSLQMLQSGKYVSALIYIFSTLIVCLLFSWLGALVGARIK